MIVEQKCKYKAWVHMAALEHFEVSIIITEWQYGASTIQDTSSFTHRFLARAQSLDCLSGAELTAGIKKRKPNTSVNWSIPLFTSRLRSGMMSVQPQLSHEAGRTLVLLFLIFHMWLGLKRGLANRGTTKG